MEEYRFDRSRVVRWIARGDLAAVLLVDDGHGGERRVIKQLHPHALHQPGIPELFASECEIACGLSSHANVVRGLEHGVVDGRPYLAMAYVEGEDLRSLRDRGVPLAHMAAGFIRQVALACHHIHQHGWVHGDVNPANVIVDGTGSASLCDFGVARRAAMAGPMRGTHAYMAPEQIRGEAWAAATDVFALGVMLWELIAGTRLFYRGASYLTMAAVIEGEVPTLPGRPALDEVVRAAVAKDPATRIPTASELIGRLDAAVTG